jgi:phosphoglycerate dehydrogenase-like enzyme
MRPNILLVDEPCYEAKEILREVATLHYQLPQACQHIIWTGLTPVNTDLTVACPCTGVDHVKAPTIIHLDEEWKGTFGRLVTSTAEHTWSLVLQLAKKRKMQLSEKILGIIGYGRIGRHIREYGYAFGMNILYYDKDGDSVTLDYILKNADVISIHVPLNDETRGMIGKRELSMMKSGALLVNTSRADIVDLDALKYALFSKEIGGYADDFFTERPIIDGLSWSPVIQTNHIGGNCIEARIATDIYIAQKTVEFIKEALCKSKTVTAHYAEMMITPLYGTRPNVKRKG